jgi:hypothetical protein
MRIAVLDHEVTGAATPLKEAVLEPWLAPRFMPCRVTVVPDGPDTGYRFDMLGGGATMKLTALLSKLETVTMTLPVTAPLGTGTTMLVPLQLVGVAAVPLNVTVLVPWVAPKFVPLSVTEVPAGPPRGDTVAMFGAGITVKFTALLARLDTTTITLPDVAPLGTGTTIPVVLQLVAVAAIPLNVTVLLPWLVPKFVPVIVMGAPIPPELGDRLVIVGKLPPPLTVTETLSKVALYAAAELPLATARPM